MISLPTHMVVSTRSAWWTLLDRSSRALLVNTEFVVILLIWQLSVGVFELVNPIFLPPPTSIGGGFWQLVSSGEVWPHLSLSLQAWALGYSLAVVAGVVVGVSVGVSLPIHRVVRPLLWTFYSIPWLAYRALTVAWFGFGLTPIIFIVFIGSLFPVLFNTAAGVGATDRSLLGVGRVFGSSRLAIYRKIILPSLLPFIFAGMRLSVVTGTSSLLVAEMTGSTRGIGALIMFNTNAFETEKTFALIVISILWIVAISQMVKTISKRIAPWQVDVRRE